MPLVSRATLGAEFYDRTSAMLLKQPEPQYLYAQLWKMALNADLRNKSDISFRGSVGTEGSPYSQLKDNQAVFEDPILESAIQVVTEIGTGVGHTIRINRPVFANTTYTEASREIGNAAISTTPISLSSEQVGMSIKRFGGPYSGSAVAPFGVDRFDASRSLHSIASAVGTHLQRDFDKTIESFIGTLLSTASTVVRTGGYTADTQFTNAGGSAPMDLATIGEVEKTLDVGNIPTFPDGYRIMVVDPTAIKQLKDDPQFTRYAEFHPPVNPVLAKSYYKSIGRMHLYKSTSLPTTTNSDTGTVYVNHAFGPGGIGSGVGDMPHTATSTADNYGEWALVIWLMYAAFGVLDNRFLVKIHHD